MCTQKTRVDRLSTAVLPLAVVLLLAGCASPEAIEPPPAGSLLISNVRIVDSMSTSISDARDVLISDGLIVEVAEGGSIAPERAALALSADGLYGLPGLIDVHAHVGDGGLGDQLQSDREGALAQFLRYGVTTIFVPGGGAGNDDWLASWKDRCGSGELSCPEIHGSGALITAPGSHPIGTLWAMSEETDPAELYARGAVAIAEDEPVAPLLDFKMEKGVDAIKIVVEDGIGPTYPMPRLSPAKIAELVEASHQRGLRVFAHVSMPQHVEDSVRAGIDGVMHSSEEPLADSLLEEMARKGVFYIATLALYDGFIDIAEGRYEQEEYAQQGVSPRALESLQGFRVAPLGSAEEARQVQRSLYGNLVRAASAGVPLALGTDVNNPQVFPGYSAHEELALMVEAGLTPAQALAAATVGGASFLQKESSLGRIEPGYEADLLIVAGNPLENILNTRALRAVVRNGRLVEGIVSTSGQPPL